MTFEVSRLTLLVSACLCSTIGFLGGLVVCSMVH
jgi:hypothetical protein